MRWPKVKDITKKSFDGRTYYMYEANASYGTLGPHTLTTVTTKVGLLHPNSPQSIFRHDSIDTGPALTMLLEKQVASA